MAKSAEVEAWFAKTKPPSEQALRKVRDIVLRADKSMSERIQYGSVTFASSKGGDLAAFVQYNKPGVNLMLMRGGRLTGRYPHLQGATVKRMLIADEKEAAALAAELKAIVKEWVLLGDSAAKPMKATGRRATAGRSAGRPATRSSAGARR